MFSTSGLVNFLSIFLLSFYSLRYETNTAQALPHTTLPVLFMLCSEVFYLAFLPSSLARRPTRRAFLLVWSRRQKESRIRSGFAG